MLELEQIYRVERRRGIIALEGWDASGKSGAIQRLVEKLDPRWVDVWSIERPGPRFARTSTAVAPWHVAPAEYKWFTRIVLAKTVIKALGKGLALGVAEPRPRKSEVLFQSRAALHP
jgi:polyphosphate kinase 2 (PPK2 family)